MFHVTIYKIFFVVLRTLSFAVMMVALNLTLFKFLIKNVTISCPLFGVQESKEACKVSPR